MLFLLYPREKGLSVATFGDPLRARSFGALFAWPFMVAFQDASSPPTFGERCVRRADSTTLRHTLTERPDVLRNPTMLPSASHIQPADLQLSQVQMCSLLNPPFPPKRLGMSTSPPKHGLHRPIGSVLHGARGRASLLECFRVQVQLLCRARH